MECDKTIIIKHKNLVIDILTRYINSDDDNPYENSESVMTASKGIIHKFFLIIEDKKKYSTKHLTSYKTIFFDIIKKNLLCDTFEIKLIDICLSFVKKKIYSDHECSSPNIQSLTSKYAPQLTCDNNDNNDDNNSSNVCNSNNICNNDNDACSSNDTCDDNSDSNNICTDEQKQPCESLSSTANDLLNIDTQCNINNTLCQSDDVKKKHYDTSKKSCHGKGICIDIEIPGKIRPIVTKITTKKCCKHSELSSDNSSSSLSSLLNHDKCESSSNKCESSNNCESSLDKCESSSNKCESSTLSPSKCSFLSSNDCNTSSSDDCDASSSQNKCDSSSSPNKCSSISNKSLSSLLGNSSDKCEPSSSSNKCESPSLSNKCEPSSSSNKCESPSLSNKCESLSPSLSNKCESSSSSNKCESPLLSDKCESSSSSGKCKSSSLFIKCENLDLIEEYIVSSVDNKIMDTINSNNRCTPDEKYCEDLKKRKIMNHKCDHNAHSNIRHNYLDKYNHDTQPNIRHDDLDKCNYNMHENACHDNSNKEFVDNCNDDSRKQCFDNENACHDNSNKEYVDNCNDDSRKQCFDNENNAHNDTCKNHIHNNAYGDNLLYDNNYEGQNITIKRQQLKNNKKIKREDNLQKMLNHIENTCKIYELLHTMSSELSNDLAEQINKYNIMGTSNIMKITDIEYCNRICRLYYQRTLMLLDKNTSTANEYNILINDDKYVELCSVDNIIITHRDDKIYLQTGKISTYSIQMIIPNQNIIYSDAIVILKHNIKQLENIVEVILTIQQIAEKSVKSFLKLVDHDVLNI